MIYVDDLIGMPWRRGARGPDAFDCWGLVLEVAARMRLDVPPDWQSRDMTRAEQQAAMARESRAHLRALREPLDGAIAFSEYASHVGIVVSGLVVHAARGSGVVAWRPSLWLTAYPDSGFFAWHA